ncbi:MAG: hypothetical protein FWE67_00235 [Planctomycetaceae bacterium]|nr:hypothetical protein [Planctomycetaceae bacterium]
MKTKLLLSFVIALSAVAVSAQEPAQEPATQPAVPSTTPPVVQPITAQTVPAADPLQNPVQPVMSGPNVMGGMPAMPRINPVVLMRMRDQMNFELQQIQRQLSFIDPNDTQMRTMLTERQSEIAKELKGVAEQLNLTEQNPMQNTLPAMPRPNSMPPNLSPQFDPSMIPGGNPMMPVAQPPMMQPNMMMQQPGMPPQRSMPTEFDQERAFADSPWVPQPSKELTELKNSVESLRKETEELKTTIKALEAQIQLLNRNILLSQPTAK